MNVETMRSEIAKVYPGDRWKYKVKAMPEYQVIAVYHDFQKTGRFEHKVIKKQTGPVYKQLTFDDILRGGPNDK